MKLNDWIHNKTLCFFVKTNGVFSKPLLSGLGHILCFHRVLPKDKSARIVANSGMEISPDKLVYIINFFLQRNYQVISPDELHKILTEKIKPEKKFIVITFDDGYVDNYQYAYPLLKKLGIPFTIYVVTDFPDHKALMWWYFLEDYIIKNNKVTWLMDDKEVFFDTTTPEEKEILFLKLRLLMLSSSEFQVKMFVKNFMGFSDESIHEFVVDNSLSWAQIIQMSNDPLVTIGSHTISHKPLSKLTEKNVCEAMLQSKQIIEQKTGKPVWHFAYPYGSYNEISPREIINAEKAGFKTSVTLLQGNVFSRHRLFTQQLPRIPLGEKADLALLNNVCNGIRHFSFNGCKKII